MISPRLQHSKRAQRQPPTPGQSPIFLRFVTNSPEDAPIFQATSRLQRQEKRCALAIHEKSVRVRIYILTELIYFSRSEAAPYYIYIKIKSYTPYLLFFKN